MPTPEELFRRSQRELRRNIGRYEREATRIYAAVRESIQQELSRVYERYAVDGVLTRAEMTKYNRLSKLEQRLNELIGDGTQKVRALNRRLTREQVNESFFRHAWSIDNAMGARLDWGLLSDDVIQAVIQNDLGKIALSRLREAGRERIQRALAQGLTRGDSFPRMAREIRGAINGTRSDAMRIIRTEGGRAQAIGSQKSYERATELGVEGREHWVATLDERTRISHGELDGEPKNEEHDGWRVPGTNVWTPGPLQSGIAAFDVNCRCDTEFRIPGLEAQARRIRGEDVQPYKTYREWRPE